MILVVQVKPQLEAVLNLLAGALLRRRSSCPAARGLPADLLAGRRGALARTATRGISNASADKVRR